MFICCEVFSLLVSILGIKHLDYFIEMFRNVTAARKFIGHSSDTFLKYVSCPHCHSIYELKILLPDKSVCSRKCSYVRFTNHPHAIRRSPCNAQLMKNVRASADTTSLYPCQLYCYHSVIDSFKDMMKVPGFVNKCEIWRARKKEEEVLADIYDGRVLDDFQNPDGKPFLLLPYNFALSLNVDWFWPTQYS